MTTRKWECMCGDFEAQVEGEPVLAVWCHCLMCRKQCGAPMQLGVWAPDNFKINKGGDNLITYTSNGTIFRNSCPKCGSFCYKVLPDGMMVAPLGALEPSVKPTCNIFCGSKGEHAIMAPDLPQHDEFP